MNTNQKAFFWSFVVCFYTSTLLIVYPQGAFDNLTAAGWLFWVGLFVSIPGAAFIWVRGNRELIDKWCG